MAKGKYQEWLEPDGLILLRGWKRDGLSDEDIAKKIGISRSTLSEWKRKYPDISDALKKGKTVCIYEIEDALTKRAKGFDTVETTEEVRTDAKGKIVGKHIKRVKKYVPPDTGAAIFLLKNLRPEKWRDRPQSEESEIEDMAGIRKAVFGE